MPRKPTVTKVKKVDGENQVKRITRKKANKDKEEDLLSSYDTTDVLYGELFWEYRAKVAEWEIAYLNTNINISACEEEKKDPKYKKLFKLLLEEERTKSELKKKGEALTALQKRIARQLGVELEVFLTKCVIDHDTGVIKFLD